MLDNCQYVHLQSTRGWRLTPNPCGGEAAVLETLAHADRRFEACDDLVEVLYDQYRVLRLHLPALVGLLDSCFPLRASGMESGVRASHEPVNI